MRILQFTNSDEITHIMHNVGVDPYGIKIMLPKALSLIIRLNSVSNINANIIKQEMLSLGGDAAVARGSLTGKLKKTDVLLLGQLLQFESLADKLKIQPFGLNKLGRELKETIANYYKNNFILKLRECSLNLSKRTYIMGVINLTPDSFSGDGLYKAGSNRHLNLALEKAEQMKKDGADIIDLGGQSSRPGAKEITLKEELLRTIPVVKLIAKKISTPISIDTNKPEVAKAAMDAGAQIINNISGLKDKNMVKVAAKYKSVIVLMHMQGRPVNMQNNISYSSLIDNICDSLRDKINSAISGGIDADKIIIDPGIGFGKTVAHNLKIIKHLTSFKILGKPILLGVSKKSFIGEILKTDINQRSIGSLAACILAANNGVNIVRVHNVKETHQALKILNAINHAHA